MKNKTIAISILILILLSVSVYYFLDHKKETEAFEEMQDSIGYLAEACKNYIISSTIEEDSDYQLQMVQSFGRISGQIYHVIEDNKFVDSDYQFMIYRWIGNYAVLFDSSLDKEKLNKHSDKLISYLSSVEDISHGYKSSDVSIETYISDQSDLINSYDIDLKKSQSINDTSLYETLRRHPDYLSFKSKEVDETFLRDALYDYFSIFDPQVEKDNIKLSRKGSLAYPVSAIDTMMFEYKTSSGLICADGSLVNIDLFTREDIKYIFDLGDEPILIKKVKDYLSIINASDYQYFDVSYSDNYSYVDAFRSLDKRSNMDGFRCFFERKDELEISRVNYPLQITKDIYDIADYNVYYDKKEQFDIQLKDYEIIDSYFYINTSLDQIDYLWKYEVLIHDELYSITFDARTEMMLFMHSML